MQAEQKLAIHELLSRVAYNLDEHRLDDLMACFSETASMTLRIAGGDLVGPFEGREGIRELMAGAMEEQTDTRRHVVSNIFFESEGESSARAVSNLSLFSTQDNKISLITAGVYHDEVVKEGNQWLISTRHLDLDLPY